MFKIGEMVIYGAQGICRIESIETKVIGKQKLDYYVLKPIFNSNTAVFVPMDNEALTAKIQYVLTKAQTESLLKKSVDIGVIAIDDETQKRELYKKILSSGDRERLIALIKTLRLEKDIRNENNKKLNISDEQTLHKAELLIYNELGYVLGVEPNEVKNIIKF